MKIEDLGLQREEIELDSGPTFDYPIGVMATPINPGL